MMDGKERGGGGAVGGRKGLIPHALCFLRYSPTPLTWLAVELAFVFVTANESRRYFAASVQPQTWSFGYKVYPPLV
jgi:hypothetical protein